MTNTVEVKVPDIGDFDNIPVIEILVKVGDTVAKDQGLVTLESDKATMEVPSSAAGVVKALKVKLGDGVSEGSVIAIVETAEAANVGGPSGPTAAAFAPAAAVAPAATPIAAPAAEGSGRKADIECRMLVLGAGPGGYTAAFRSADLGLDTVLVERYPSLGGVCLNVGCIPSKALLHAAAVIDEAAHAKDYGIDFGAPKIGLDALRGYKEKVVGQLTKGLAGMSKQRKVRVVQGVGKFVSAHEIEIHSAEGGGDAGTQLIRFEQCIIAVGSQPVKLPAFPWDDPRIMDSTDALELKDIPKNLLVVGGGIIGLEMATVYRALGSAVTVVEFMEQIMPGTDTDLIKPLADRMKKQGVAIHLKTKVVEAKATEAGIVCSFDGASIPSNDTYDRVLVAVGRTPNGKKIDAQKAGVAVSERGFIEVDRQMRTNVAHIFAIGDLVGQPMLAHKATHEGKLAAEVAAGEKKEWVARVIPSVAYTDPEIAWVGVTETEAKAKGITVGVGKFPWAASGRAIGNGRTEGFTKLLFDEATHRVIGGGIVGTHAGDLIAEVGLAIEMGCEVADIGHTIHPHPTLSESVGMAAEVFDGTITDLYIPKKK